MRYVAGVPEARGMGNVTLDITVTERSTGYEEKTRKLLNRLRDILKRSDNPGGDGLQTMASL